MDEVFTLTKKESEYRNEVFVYSSQNIYDIIDKMFSVGYCNVEDFEIYVTIYGRNSIPWHEWRKQQKC